MFFFLFYFNYYKLNYIIFTLFFFKKINKQTQKLIFLQLKKKINQTNNEKKT